MASTSGEIDLLDGLLPDETPVEHPLERPFVAMSRFAVANDKLEEVKSAFRNRPHLVDQAPGFIRMAVISPEQALDEIWLITWWTDRGSFLTWHHSDNHKQSHRLIPKGLKLDPARTSITYFEHVTD